MSMQDVLLAIYNFSELKSLANNTKIRSSLKFLLVWYAFFLNHCNTCNVLQPSSSFPKNGIVGNKNTNFDSYTTEIRIEIYINVCSNGDRPKKTYFVSYQSLQLESKRNTIRFSRI